MIVKIFFRGLIMKRLMACLISGVCFGINCNSFAGVEGVVNADLLNLRQAPGLKSLVMGKIRNGAKVKILRLVDNWAELEVPEYLPMYVSEALIVNGKTISEVNMRSAKAVEAPSFGMLPKGATVTMLPERGYGWVRIVPPAGLKVYAAKMFIAFDHKKLAAKTLQPEKPVPVNEAPAEKTVVQPTENKKTNTPEPVKKESEITVPPVPPAVDTKAQATPKLPEIQVPAPVKLTADQQRELVRLGANAAVPGQPSAVEGKLFRVEYSDSTATDYAIMSGSNNLGFIFWLPGSARNDLLNKKVRVEGVSYSISGAKAPVIIPGKIEVVVEN